MGVRGKGSAQRGGGRGGSYSGKRKRGMSRPQFDAKRMGDDDLTNDDEDEEDDSEQGLASGEEEEDDDDDDEGEGSNQGPSHYSLLMKNISKKSKERRDPREISSGRVSYKRVRTEDGKGDQACNATDGYQYEEYNGDPEDGKPQDGPEHHEDSALGHIGDNIEQDPGSQSDDSLVKSGDEVDEPEDADPDPEGEIVDEIFEIRESKDGFDHDDHIDDRDPFQFHFAEPNQEEVASRIEAIKASKWKTSRAATKSTRSVVMMADTGGNQNPPSLPAPIRDPSSLNLKKRLQDSLAASGGGSEFDDKEQSFASLLFNYHDLLYCKRTHSNAPKLRKLLCLHALNHCFKTRDRVLKNSDKINQAVETGTEPDFRDQGFSRPKVLFLLPTRESCARAVHTITSLLGKIGREHAARFEDSFVDKEAKFSNDKPADFLDLFDGNDDDNFRIGVKLTRKTIKLYSQFYSSDIILASPLGLRMAMEGDSKKNKAADHEYLSSIEMVIVDQADALLMQNWEHVEHIFSHLNLMPESTTGWDITRIRPWYFQQHARYYRQTIVLSQFNTPELTELQRLHCLNWAGKCRVQPEYMGEIQQVGVKLRQNFTRFDSPTVAGDPDARFKYFAATIIPMLAKKPKSTSGTLLFIPSYMDFVRVRNYFANSTAAGSISFGTISEYSDVREVSRAMSHFKTGRHRVLLYTERAHHFRRHVIRAAKKIIMYSLPDNPIFYREMVGFLAKSEEDGTLDAGKSQGLVRVCFSKYDVMKLERVVGTSRVGKMMTERGDVFDFL